jgi:anti-sigma B factor antagonist
MEDTVVGRSSRSGGASVDASGRWVLWGEIDVTVAWEVHEILEETVDGTRKTLDLEQVTFIDSSGLRLILLACGGASRPRLLNVPPVVRDVLEMTSLDSFVDMVDEPSA